MKRDFDINPYSYAMNTSRTLDKDAYYTRNYAPFNILHELDANYMDLDVVDTKFQAELKWEPVKGLELAALAAVKYNATVHDPGKAFFTLWTLKESYMKMTGRGMSLPLDSFEIIRKDQGFVLGKSPKRPGFFRTMEFEDYIFSVCMESDFSLPPKGFTELL